MTHSTYPGPQPAPRSSSSYPTAAYPSISSVPQQWLAQAPTQQYSSPHYPTLTYSPAVSSPAVSSPAVSQPRYDQAQYQQPYDPTPYDRYTADLAYDYRQEPLAGAQGVAPRGSAARRPRSLTVAVGSGLLASGLVVASQVFGLLDGRAALQAWRDGQVPAGVDPFGPQLSAALDVAYRVLTFRAYVSIALAVVLAVTLVLSLRAGLIARVFSVVFMGLAALATLVSLWDIFPGVAKVVGAVGLVLLPLATVLMFQPTVAGYRLARGDGQAAG